MLTKARLKFMTLNLDFSIDKAQRVLGYRPRGRFPRRHARSPRLGDRRDYAVSVRRCAASLAITVQTETAYATCDIAELTALARRDCR